MLTRPLSVAENGNLQKAVGEAKAHWKHQEFVTWLPRVHRARRVAPNSGARPTPEAKGILWYKGFKRLLKRIAIVQVVEFQVKGLRRSGSKQWNNHYSGSDSGPEEAIFLPAVSDLL